MSSPLERLLDRLDNPRRAGAGWVARCPAHDDGTASLHLAVGEGGAVVLHCFAGCAAAQVVAAVGLSLADLFDRPLHTSQLSPEQRRTLHRETRIARQWAALGAVLPELAIVEVAAAQVAQQKVLSFTEAQRVAQAHSHIVRVRLDVQQAIR